VRLHQIRVDEIMAHMSDPRTAIHLPLLDFAWTMESLTALLTAKEERWRLDGLGHWAILCDGIYAGWGGFEKDGGDWDFGLVLKPEYFGLGLAIVRKALEFARSDERIAKVTFLLPPSRKRQRALSRLGAGFVGEINYAGARFLKYRMATDDRPMLSGPS